MKLSHTVTLLNDLGLHARPASKIATIMREFSSKVIFTYNKKTVDAKQVLSLLLLEAKKNARIEVEIEGSDAKEALSSLIDCFENRFGEDR